MSFYSLTHRGTNSVGCDCHHPSLTAGMCIRTKAYSGFLPQIVLTMCSAFICVLMSLFLHLCMRHLRAYSHHFSISGLKRNLGIINNAWHLAYRRDKQQQSCIPSSLSQYQISDIHVHDIEYELLLLDFYRITDCVTGLHDADIVCITGYLMWLWDILRRR